MWSGGVRGVHHRPRVPLEAGGRLCAGRPWMGLGGGGRIPYAGHWFRSILQPPSFGVLFLFRVLGCNNLLLSVHGTGGGVPLLCFAGSARGGFPSLASLHLSTLHVPGDAADWSCGCGC